MEQSKHTPTPWEAIGSAVHAECGREIVFGAHMSRSGTDDEKRANAAFIVRAVNSHAALVEALQKVERWLPKSDLVSNDQRVIREAVRTALALAGE